MSLELFKVLRRNFKGSVLFVHFLKISDYGLIQATLRSFSQLILLTPKHILTFVRIIGKNIYDF